MDVIGNIGHQFDADSGEVNLFVVPGIADDASTAPQVREWLTYYQAQDDRIKVTFRSENGHISACSNSALAIATGDFVGLLDHPRYPIGRNHFSVVIEK